jgi:NAD(P)-dependent dehydrogenase (short-subunit alcohol dehydrogenase family)
MTGGAEGTAWEAGPSPERAAPGRVVLVTGGTRGIGRAIADRFAAGGDRVAVCGRRPPEACEHLFVPADVREPDQVEALIQAVIATWGRLDVVVNNAGGAPPADAATASPRFHEAIIRANLTSVLHVSQAAKRVMGDGGVIVNLGSTAGLRASPTVAAYGAAKAGVIALTASLASAWAPGIRVVAVSPGLVLTPDVAAHAPDLDALARRSPQRRLCLPEDVAAAVWWLASPEAAFANGSNLVLEGGQPGSEPGVEGER